MAGLDVCKIKMALDVTEVAEFGAIVRKAALVDAVQRECVELVRQRTESAAAAQALGEAWEDLEAFWRYGQPGGEQGFAWRLHLVREALAKIVDPPIVGPYCIQWYDGEPETEDDVEDIDDELPPCERCSVPCAPQFCPLGGKWREANGITEEDDHVG
ncbi:MAG: hypothetical protein ABIY70_18235 [Capsulimonas sp.]|uniref:hypothetical protein n=1 Tax=Capsulimonas sp. TaxID=2494211 RepID=UPI003264FBCB